MKALLAKSKATGLYFNGTNFSEPDYRKAMHLRPGTTSEDFRLAWAGEVVVEERVLEDSRSLAQQIHSGDITPEVAARRFIRKQINERRERGCMDKSFLIYVPSTGKWISRIPKMPCTRNVPAWVKFAGSQHALVWKNGELCIG